MKNKRGMEIAFSTIIYIIIGLIVLIGIIYLVTGGFKKFGTTAAPFTDTAQASSVKQACDLACMNQDKMTYCCKSYTIDDKSVNCRDTRLDVKCAAVDCGGFACG